MQNPHYALVAYVLSLNTSSRDEGSERSSSDPDPKEIARTHREVLVKHIDRLGPYARALLALAYPDVSSPEPPGLPGEMSL